MPSLHPAVSFLVLAPSLQFAVAQCDPAWLPGFGCAGTNGPVRAAVRWDADGPGPVPAVVVFGGEISLAGTVPCAGLVGWQPTSGAFVAIPAPPAPGAGMPFVTSLAVLPDHRLVAAVRTATATASRVATWDGLQWAALGADLAGDVTAMLVRSNGELVVGGEFALGGSSTDGLARWTGAAWQGLGSGIDGRVEDLAEDSNGDLLAVGWITSAGGVPSNGFCRWNGSSWAAGPGFYSAKAVAAVGGRTFVGAANGLYQVTGTAAVQVPGLAASPNPFASIDALVPLANGDLVVGGNLTQVANQATATIGVLDPATLAWRTCGGGLQDGYGHPGHLHAVVDMGNGDFVVGGDFGSADGGTRSLEGMAQWRGGQWSALADGTVGNGVRCAAVLDDKHFAIGGDFASLGNLAAAHVAAWTDTGWAPLGPGLGGTVLDLAWLPNGDLLAVGSFLTTGNGTVARGMARWDGSAWSEFGGGMQSTSGPIRGEHVLVRSNGDVVVAGSFTAAGGVPANGLAVWNGLGWTGPVVSANPHAVTALAAASNGDLLVGIAEVSGTIVRRWHGPTWSDELVLGIDDWLTALVGLPNGEVAAAGYASSFSTGNRGFVAIGSGGGGIRYDAISSRSIVTGLALLPDGDLLISGAFAGLATASSTASSNVRDVARLRGTFFVPPPPVPFATAHARFPGGDLLLVGPVGVPGTSIHGLGRLSSPCLATGADFGNGCGGARLTAGLPWLGGTWHAVADGLPALAAVFAVTSFGTTWLPLQNVIPTALPGCVLQVPTDVVVCLLANAGAAQVQFQLPRDVGLVGTTFHHQMVAVALNGTLATTATNAQVLTAGMF